MQLRAIRSTLIAVPVMILLLAPRHLGFMLLFVAIPLVPWFLYSLYIIATQPTRRALQGSKVGVWMVGVLTVIGIHVYYHVSTRDNANEIVSAIQIYVKEHGSCPPAIEAIGMSQAQLRSELGYAGYYCQSGKPKLFYGSTYVPFEQESYDFDNSQWRHIYD
jgi:energy-coupling factor transporter transmembrane protein EcfT